jgi:hypothetical protein
MRPHPLPAGTPRPKPQWKMQQLQICALHYAKDTENAPFVEILDTKDILDAYWGNNHVSTVNHPRS